MRTGQALSVLMLVVVFSSCGRVQSPTVPSSTQRIEPPASTTPDSSSLPPDTPWLVFSHERGVSINYPADWSIESTAEGALLESPGGSRILLQIYPRPLNDRALTDPNTWVPNQGGYEIHWSKPVTISHAEGLEFIWGVYHENSWDLTPQLMAVLYSQEHEMDIRLSTFFDNETIALLAKEGPDRTISTHFHVFEHILQSIQMAME